MKRSLPRLVLALCFTAMVVFAALPGHTVASTPGRAASDDANTLTILTCCGMWEGFNNPNYAAAGVIPYARFYSALWKKRFPHLKIKEIDVQTYDDLISKTILGVNAGNPPDLIGTQGQLGLLVARHAVMNLDPFYARSHVDAGKFLPALANWARMNNHWYALPTASAPAVGELVYIPKLVQAAGWDPNKMPLTWDGLWAFTQKVTKWDRNGNLVRIGMPIHSSFLGDEIDLYCGSFAIYDSATHAFHANSPCIKSYFAFEKRLLDFYGGVAKYTKFIGADPTIWNGYTPKAYLPSGKVLLDFSGFWTGLQLDQYWNVYWKLSPPPTPHGTLAERQAVDVGAQQVEIPTGAKHAQLAWDFATFTLWDYGYLQGPTTNGYTLLSQAQPWANIVAQNAGQTRAKNHFPGNPMAQALKLVMQDGALGRTYAPTDVASPYYFNYLDQAWQQIEYGRATVDQALDQAQHLIDVKQQALRAQFGM